MLENKAQNSSGKQALRSTKFHALSRVIKEGYVLIYNYEKIMKISHASD
jgi:hypothetical protein